jgi:hypothetical protein
MSSVLLLATLPLLAAQDAVGAPGGDAPRRPNILFAIADD